MRTEPPTVSVVVPSFNQGRFIGEAIDSILSQAYPALEVLVMDGGSTDGTLAILESYGDRIRYESGPDGGQAAALNRGFEQARGKIVAWLNSDDRYCPGAVAAGVAALEAAPEAGFVYGKGELIAEDGRVLSAFTATHEFDLWRLTRVIDFIMQPAVFMRARTLRAAGGLDPSLNYGLDWDLWIRMALRRPAVYCASVLAQSREHAVTKTASGGFGRWWELKQIVSRYGGSIGSPAVAIYGLDALRRKWPTVFGPRTPEEKVRLAERPVARFFGRVHRMVVRLLESRISNSQGIATDGWITKRGFMALPWSGAGAQLTVNGDVSAPASDFPLRIQVRAVGQHAVVTVNENGDFEVTLELAPDEKGRRPLEIEVRASRQFRVDGDSRRFGFRVGQARLDDHDGVWVVRPFSEDRDSFG